MPEASAHIQQISASSMEGWEVYTEGVKRQQAGQDIVMLAIGDHDFPTPAPSVEACKAALDAGHHGYVNIQGIPKLVSAMAKISTRATGVETTTDEVIALTGGQGALYAAMQATLDPGDHIIIVSPHYVTFPGTARSAEAEFTLVSALAENGFEPKAADIEAAIQDNTKVLLINSPNNPTCVIYSEQTLREIAEVCIKHDLWLISDEVYWSLSKGRHVSARSFPGMKERTLVVNSMSKSHGMTGWRIGWLTAPAHIVENIIELNLNSTYGLPDFISHAAAEALENDYGVEEIAKTYHRRGDVFLAAIRETNCVRPANDSGSLYIMLDVRDLTPDGREFAWRLLDEENIAVMPGESFGPSTAGHIRVSLCLPEEKLKLAAETICRFVATYPDKRKTD